MHPFGLTSMSKAKKMQLTLTALDEAVCYTALMTGTEWKSGIHVLVQNVTM